MEHQHDEGDQKQQVNQSTRDMKCKSAAPKQQ